MSKKEIDPRYIPENYPPIDNPILYAFRVVRKLFIVGFFGLGTAIVCTLVFPFIRLLNCRNRENFRRAGHHFISVVLDFYIHLMQWIHISLFTIDDLEKLRNLKGYVIVANHPSLLDVIYTLAFVRHADCLVKADLKKGWVSGVVNNLYIANNVDFDSMTAECKKCLDEGSNLIIFPEGTRSPYQGSNPYKKGAARIALACGANVQCMHIGGNKKYGLGKFEPMVWAPHDGPYRYEFKVLDQIDVSQYKDLPDAIAAKRLTEDMRKIIDSAD